MADVLDPITASVANLDVSVKAATAKISELAGKIANTADPAEVAALAAQVDAEAKALNDAVNPPPPPTPAS